MSRRFQPSAFDYNGRVAFALVPSLVVITGFGGSIALGALVVHRHLAPTPPPTYAPASLDAASMVAPCAPQVGAMVVYILDALRYKEAAFGAIWATLGSVNLTMLLTGVMFPTGRPVVLGIMVTLAGGATLLLVGEHAMHCAVLVHVEHQHSQWHSFRPLAG